MADGPFDLSGFDVELVEGGLGQPISLEFLPGQGNRLLVIQKTGEILILDAETGNSQTYMDLNDHVSGLSTNGERGLLDITLDPDFENNGYFYLYYTPTDPSRAVVARFQHDEVSGGLTSRGDIDSRSVIWTDADGYTSCCHYGGGLDFGPDGKIWLTVSDKFSATNPGEGGDDTDLPIDLTSTTGKVIRINSDGTIPDGTDGWPANPYLDGTALDPNGEYPDSIWAYGLRNPFRASWDHEYGYFYMAEVGGNNANLSGENLHVASLDQPGVFYGWPFYEGVDNTYTNNGASEFEPNDFPQPDSDIGDPAAGDFYSAPIFAYPREDGASISGGFVYRGDLFPTEWDGVYFYGDYTRDNIRYLVLDDDGITVLGDHDFKPTTDLPGDTNAIVFLAEGNDGALYYINYSSQSRGQIFRVTHGGNEAPSFTSESVTPLEGDPPFTVTFFATVEDPDQDDLTYVVTFGDGQTASGDVVNGQISVTHEYVEVGQYTASISISDGVATVFSDPYQVAAGDIDDAPVFDSAAADALSGDPGLVVTFTANVSDEDTPLAELTYTVVFGDGTTVTGTPDANGDITATHIYDDEGNFAAYLEVEDATSTTRSSVFNINVGDVQGVPVGDGLVLALESYIKIGVVDGQVTNWLDGSGAGNNLTAFGDPQLVPDSTPTGMPAIVFDGSGDFLERVDTLDGFSSGSEARTVFIVVDYEPGSQSAGVAYGNAAANETFGAVIDHKEWLSVQGYGGSNDDRSPVKGDTGGFLVQSVVLNANGDYTHYKDGVAIEEGNHTYDTGLSRLVIGQEIGGAGERPMQVAGVFIYNRALTDAERQQVETYLQETYITGPQGGGNRAPVALDDSFSTPFETFVAGDVLVNDSDGDNDPLTVTLDADVANGSLTLNPDGSFSYTPDAGFSGTDSFTYIASDGTDTDSATATITVAPGGGGNQPPVAQDDSYTTSFETLVAGDVSANDTDGDNDPLNITLDTDVTNGTLVLNPDGSFSYTPDDGFSGADSFDYIASDGTDTDTATATITVGTPPTGGTGIVTDGLVLNLSAMSGVSQNGGTALGWADASGLGNDLTAYGDPQFVQDSTPTGAPSIELDGQGDFLERIDTLNGFSAGSEARTVFIVVDYEAGSHSAGVAYGNGASNETFGAVIDNKEFLSVQGYGGKNDDRSPVKGDAGGFLVQSIVLDGAGNYTHFKDGIAIEDGNHTYDTVLSRLVIGQEIAGAKERPMKVAAVLVYDRDLTEAERQQVESHLQETYITGEPVGGGNQAPVALDDSYSAAFETLVEGDVTVNDSDADNDPLTITLDSDVSNGTLVLNPDGTFSYTPDAGFSGDDSFVYVASDGTDSDTATATITVAPGGGGGNQAPVAVDDGFSTAFETLVSGNVLSNDTDADNDPLTATVVTGVANGTLVLNGDGSFDYTPDTGFSGTDSFTYSAGDGIDSDTATVTFSVGAPPSGSGVVYGGLVAFWEADQNVIHDPNTGIVSGWLGGAGNGTDLIGAGDPRLVENATPSGEAAISFDGDGDYLERVGADKIGHLPSGDAPRTVLMVVDYIDSNGATAGVTWGAGGSPGNGAFGVTVSGTRKENLTIQGWGGGNDFRSSVDGIGDNDGSAGDDWFVQSVTYDGADIFHYRDNALIDSDSHVFETALDRLVIGEEIQGLGAGEMDVAAVFIYDRVLSSAELQQMDDYLSEKYLADELIF